MAKKNKKKKWTRLRHRIITGIGAPVMGLFSRLRYGVKIEKFKEQGKRAYLILLNHQTVFDQFYVAASFRGPIYYVATEDIFSNGWVSSLIRWLVAPIPIKKQTTDVSAVMNCLRVAKEGGTICIAPEGNRTYSGRTEYMNPAIGGLAKKLGLPIALYRIEGGYGIQPRWCDGVRRGKMKAYVSRVIEPEEYKNLTPDQLAEMIAEGLYVDETQIEGKYTCKARAQYMERAMYVCPYCGLSVFESHGHEIECKSCGRKVVYGEDKRLRGVGFDFPFEYVAQWYDYQKEFVNHLMVNQHTEQPLYRDTANFSQVIVYKEKLRLRDNADVCLYGDRVVVGEGTPDPVVFPFDEVMAVSVLGRNKLNIYHDDKVYQFKGSKSFNALKYVNIYYRYRNITRGNADGKFLGL